MTVTTFAPALTELVEPGATVERVATGFLFTEGPLWDHDSQRLLFTDLAGDVMRQWSEATGVVEVRRPSGKANGLTYDTGGRLIACEHVGRRVTRTDADGTITVLASTWANQPLNSPNDVVVKSDGSIYFTDPPYGLMDYYGIARPQDLPHQGVYRIDPTGQVSLLRDDFAAPNGLAFSPDETRLYINDTERQHVCLFDVQADGTLANRRIFFDFGSAAAGLQGAADGLKLDERGNLYTTGPGGIWILAPSGDVLGRIAVPEGPSNLNWGGPTARTLYITAGTSVYRLETKVAGNAVPGRGA